MGTIALGSPISHRRDRPKRLVVGQITTFILDRTSRRFNTKITIIPNESMNRIWLDTS